MRIHFLAMVALFAFACNETSMPPPEECSLVLCAPGDPISSVTAEEMVLADECVEVLPEDDLVEIDDGRPACIRVGDGECVSYCLTTCPNQPFLCIRNGGPIHGGELLCSNDPCEGGVS